MLSFDRELSNAAELLRTSIRSARAPSSEWFGGIYRTH
jgi:hypothetical protein